jgi:hypothetical protein
MKNLLFHLLGSILLITAYISIGQKPAYSTVKANIKEQRQILATRYLQADSLEKSNILSEASILLTKAIVDSLVPYWYGTGWDFNGYTNIPNQGTIACGYLVSTTLKHAGVNVNRYRLAQQSALNEIRSIENGECIYYKRNTDVDRFLQYCKTDVPDGLYMIGLDNHVGYLIIKNNQIDFIHSSYLSPSKVVREAGDQSEALSYSSSFYLGRISNNQGLLEKWVLESEVKVRLDSD